jgi:hypothetical protein
MTPHLTEEQVRLYRERSLAAADLLGASSHVAECEPCRARITSTGELHARVAAFRRVLDTQTVVPVHLTYDAIAAYVDGQQSGQQAEHSEAHARECPLCANDIAQMQALKSEIHAEHKTSNRLERIADFARSILSWKGSLALAGAAACVLFALFLVQPRDGRNISRQATASPVQIAAIRDGTMTISIGADGTVSGLDGLPDSSRASLGRVLVQGEIPPPAALSDLSGKRGVLLGSSTEASAVDLLGPLSVVVETERPRFRWKPIPGAMYRVSVYNEGYDPVATSGWIRGAEWQPQRALARGARYSWQLNARTNGQEITLPAPPAPEARFRVLDAAGEAEIAQWKAAAGDSHLLLGVHYAQAGMLDDAEAELRHVRDENPTSRIVAGLLASVERLRNSKP